MGPGQVDEDVPDRRDFFTDRDEIADGVLDGFGQAVQNDGKRGGFTESFTFETDFEVFEGRFRHFIQNMSLKEAELLIGLGEGQKKGFQVLATGASFAVAEARNGEPLNASRFAQTGGAKRMLTD